MVIEKSLSVVRMAPAPTLVRAAGWQAEYKYYGATLVACLPIALIAFVLKYQFIAAVFATPCIAVAILIAQSVARKLAVDVHEAEVISMNDRFIQIENYPAAGQSLPVPVDSISDVKLVGGQLHLVVEGKLHTVSARNCTPEKSLVAEKIARAANCNRH